MGNKVLIFYKNWKGDEKWREIIPQSIFFGSTKWHPENQWFLKALDVKKNEVRDFAMKDILEWK